MSAKANRNSNQNLKTSSGSGGVSRVNSNTTNANNFSATTSTYVVIPHGQQPPATSKNNVIYQLDGQNFNYILGAPSGST